MADYQDYRNITFCPIFVTIYLLPLGILHFSLSCLVDADVNLSVFVTEGHKSSIMTLSNFASSPFSMKTSKTFLYTYHAPMHCHSINNPHHAVQDQME